MVRGNCDYLFLQPIYNATQRQVLWDLEVGLFFFPHYGHVWVPCATDRGAHRHLVVLS
jgi:hypothetical protein